MTKHQLTLRRQKAIRKQVKPCLCNGQILSNIAHNYKDHPDVPADLRAKLSEYQMKWDESVKLTPKWIWK